MSTKAPAKEEIKELLEMYPVHDRIVVRRDEETKVTKGGLVVPDKFAEKPVQGTVVAVGKGKVLESGVRVAMEVKVGDRILFGKYAGAEVKLDDEDYTIMREADVMVILKAKRPTIQ